LLDVGDFYGMVYIQDMARRIARVSAEAKLDINEDVYVDQFKPFLMDIVHSWCKGASFLQLCKMTDIFEGKGYFCLLSCLDWLSCPHVLLSSR
jgi:superfamily II RNA helicase